jgi:hypothetical protein
VKVRHGRSQEERVQRVERYRQRLKTRAAYDKLRQEITTFNALPEERRIATKTAHISKVNGYIEAIEALELVLNQQNANKITRHYNCMEQFKESVTANTNAGGNIEIFEEMAMTSDAAAPLMSRVQRRRLVREQANANSGADAKREAAAEQEADPNDEEPSINAGSNTSDITGDDLLEVGVAALVGKASWMLVRQGGKWVLKGSNPWVAGALTAVELYRLGCYLKARNKS